MKTGNWYQQTFSDQVLYFKADRELKNDGVAGILLTYFPPPSRKKMKGRAYSVPRHAAGLWKEATELPEAVRKLSP